MKRLFACFGVLIAASAAARPPRSQPRPPATAAPGPLRVHRDNPRYFTDGTKRPDGSLKAVYVTGSHYLPEGDTVTVDLSGAKGDLTVEWLDPVSDETFSGGRVLGGAPRKLEAPAEGPAVLYLRAASD